MKLLSLAVVIFTSLFSHSEFAAAQVSGRVRHELTKRPVASVLVTLNGNAHFSMTNEKGAFEFTGLPKGQYILETRCLGFQVYRDTLRIGENDSLSLEISLAEEIMELPLAVVRSYSMTGGMTQDMQIPGSAYYLPLRSLERFDYADPNRVLSAIPGIQIQEEDGFGLRPNIGFRGSGVERSSKITVMEDGVLAAPAPYTAPAAYYFPTIARMHGVEVLKGSSQIEYGPFTTGGAINLLSMPVPADFSGRISTSAGSFDSQKTMVEIGGSKGGFGIAAQYFRQGSDGFKQLPDHAGTGFNKQDYLFKAMFRTRNDRPVQHLFMAKWGHTAESSNETYLGLTLDDFAHTPYARYAGSQEDEMNTTHFQHLVRHTLIGPGALAITTTAYLNTFSRNWYKLDRVLDAGGKFTGISDILNAPEQYESAFELIRGERSGAGLNVKANNRSYASRGVQTVVSKTFDTGKARHDIRLGMRIHYDQVDRYQWVDTFTMQNGSMGLVGRGIPGTESNRIEYSNAYSAYLKYELSIGRLTILPGLRLEDIRRSRKDYGKADPDRTGSQLSERQNKTTAWIPGIGMDYKMTDATSLYAGMHRGFAPPGAQPEARPESSLTFETGIKVRNESVNMQTVLFYSAYENLLGSDLSAAGGMGSDALFNGGQATTYGLEFQVGGDLTNWLNAPHLNLPFQVNYTYTDAYFNTDFESEFEGWGEVEDGDELPYMASHRLTLQVAAERARWSFSMQGSFTSSMRATAGKGEIPVSEQIPAYFTVDLSSGFKISRGILLRAQLYNVLNEAYIVSLRPAGARPGLPRMLQFGIQAEF